MKRIMRLIRLIVCPSCLTLRSGSFDSDWELSNASRAAGAIRIKRGDKFYSGVLVDSVWIFLISCYLFVRKLLRRRMIPIKGLKGHPFSLLVNEYNHNNNYTIYKLGHQLKSRNNSGI